MILFVYRAYMGCIDQHECGGEQKKNTISKSVKLTKKVGRRMSEMRAETRVVPYAKCFSSFSFLILVTVRIVRQF